MMEAARGLSAAAARTPLDVMLAAMEAHVAAGDLDRAAAWAKDAAPYVHPRLASVEPGAKDAAPASAGDAASNRQLAMAILALLRAAAGDEGAVPNDAAGVGASPAGSADMLDEEQR
jgi:hypothetical protein